MALVVSDMITAFVSLEQAQVEASNAKLRSVPDPTPVLQMPQGTEGGDQSEEVQTEEVSQSNYAEDTW